MYNNGNRKNERLPFMDLNSGYNCLLQTKTIASTSIHDLNFIKSFYSWILIKIPCEYISPEGVRKKNLNFILVFEISYMDPKVNCFCMDMYRLQ